MKKIFSFLLLGIVSLFFFHGAEAKTVNENYDIEFNQCYYNGFGGSQYYIYDSTEGAGAMYPSVTTVTVTFDVRAYNNSTGTFIAENESVPVNTPVRFEVDLTNNTNISWFVTGTSMDSPYGEWSDAAPGLYPFRYYAECGGAGESNKETFVKRPPLNFDHSGSSASLSCNANGSICTVTGAGTLATSISFAPLSMGFGGDGVGVYPGYEGPRVRTFNYGPTITYPIQVAGSGNNPPAAPTITGPTSGNPTQSYSFNFQAADPNSDTIRYGIDWDNNASVDQWVPGSGYVASNTSQSSSYSWSSTGSKTFKALAQDSNGASSGWSSHSITINPTGGENPPAGCGGEGVTGGNCQAGEEIISQCAPTERYQVTSNGGFDCPPSGPGGYDYYGPIGACVYDAACVAPTGPTANLTINGSDGPLSVTRGSALNLSWITTGSSGCTAWGAGWGSGGAVSINGTATTTANQTDTYILQCTNGSVTVTDSVQVNLTNSLKICQNSCSSGVMRGEVGGTGSFTLARNGQQNLVACFNSAAGCSDSSGDVTATSSWSEGGSNVISLSGTQPKVVTGDNSGTEAVSVNYSSQTASSNVTVTCIPTVSCDNAPQSSNTCENDTFTVDNGCGATITCNGTKTCNYNWKEVAP